MFLRICSNLVLPSTSHKKQPTFAFFVVRQNNCSNQTESTEQPDIKLDQRENSSVKLIL